MGNTVQNRPSRTSDMRGNFSEQFTLTLMVNMIWVWLFRTSTALLWVMSSKLTPLAARIWSPIFRPCCSASPPGSNLTRQHTRKRNYLLCVYSACSLLQAHNVCRCVCVFAYVFVNVPVCVSILRDVYSQAELLAPPYVEAQTVVVRGGVQVDDPAQGTV